MSFSDKIAKDHAFGGTISYAGEWHEEVLGFVRNQVGRITWKIHEVNIAWMRFDIHRLNQIIVIGDMLEHELRVERP